ncbi:MAG TPA: hypothetical protein VN577_16625 [Terriglobales bacterium]|nr:hypothetical protein [Terriglobales bacterium]
MAIVIVGGHSRSVGKTSTVAEIISAFPQYRWTAVKITQYGHGICSANGNECDCATPDHSWAVTEEHDRSGESDTSRFLVAGAEKVYWVRTRQGLLAEAMPRIRQLIAGAGNIIFESNSLMKFVRPDLYLSLLDFDNPDFKSSAREFLDRADAFLCQGSSGEPAWDAVSLRLIHQKPQFRIAPPPYVTPEVAGFIGSRLLAIATK